jgi:hypothetical protein
VLAGTRLMGVTVCPLFLSLSLSLSLSPTPSLSLSLSLPSHRSHLERDGGRRLTGMEGR